MARCLHAEHNKGLQGLGLRQGGNPHWTLLVSKLVVVGPARKHTAPGLTPKGARPLPFLWLETQHRHRWSCEASRGLESFQGHKNRRNKANTQQLCAGSACGLLESLGRMQSLPLSVRLCAPVL